MVSYIFGAIIIVILVISVILHEYAHGKVSYLFGDTTPKDEGRLTLNPIKHLDPVGSVFLPLFLILLNTGFVIGWAKPVPINPDNYSNRKLGWILTSLAGPLTNYLLAFISLVGLVIVNFYFSHISEMVFVKLILWYFFAVNFILGSFNILPLPPLDGFWILLNVLPERISSLMYKVVETKYYPLMIILTAVIAIGVSRYTVIPLLVYLEDYLLIRN